MPLSRRDLIKGSAAAGLGLVVIGKLTACGQDAAPTVAGPGYGKLVRDPDGVLDLPEGFEYRVVSRAGDPLTGAGAGADAGRVPGFQDGMGAFEGRQRGTTVLVVNHEQDLEAPHPVEASADLTYDPGAIGGTTTIVVDSDGRRVSQEVSLAGTLHNCAGGVTPWGTWLTCEETEQRIDPLRGIAKDHGFVFEVHPNDPDANRDPAPIESLGRFPHEAVAIDPAGDVYLTEDAAGPNGLLYRFRPERRPIGPETMRGSGVLEAMAIEGVADLAEVTEVGEELPVQWKRVPDPAASFGPTRAQFSDGSITRVAKLEGACWGDNRAWVVSSYARPGGDADHDGQVWSYDPRRQSLKLEVRFPVNEDPERSGPDGPDNVTMSPHGGLMLAEDGQGLQQLVAVSADGEAAPFARAREETPTGLPNQFAGPVFSPDGRILFANLQGTSTTLAVVGDWSR